MYLLNTPHLYADDTAIIATSNDPRVASKLIEEELGLIEALLKKWRIAVNAQISVQVTFSLRPGSCPPVTLNGYTIPSSETKKMYCLLGPRSQLSLDNKLRLHKVVLKRCNCGEHLGTLTLKYCRDTSL